jgi:hypothetical protein
MGPLWFLLLATILAAFGCISPLLGIHPGVFLVNLAVLAALFGLLQLAWRFSRELNSLNALTDEANTKRSARGRLE